jgi:hypothetical protein
VDCGFMAESNNKAGSKISLEREVIVLLIFFNPLHKNKEID